MSDNITQAKIGVVAAIEHLKIGDPLSAPNALRLLDSVHVRLAAVEADADAHVERLEAALRRFLKWAEQQCPCENEKPDPCPLCDASIANFQGCKAIDAKFPPRILADARAALDPK